MEQYYLQTHSGQEGPFSLETLRLKNIRPETPVWYKGLHDWIQAGEVDALKPLFTDAGAPPPFTSFNPPPYRAEDRKNGFRLSLLHWAAIGAVVVAGFLFFSKQGDASTSANYVANEIIDSTAEFVDEAEAERKRINAQITAKNTNYRNNWSRFIKASAGSHKINSLGGVYDLETVVENQTEYPLDEVVVAVYYVKDNGGTHKTEYVNIYNVPANGKASMPAPDSNRGTSVKFEIIGIQSKKMHFLYTPDIEVRGKDDPYFSRS